MTEEQCEGLQESWTGGNTPIVAATSVFGMGVDWSDLGLVLHYLTNASHDCRMLQSLEAYVK